MDILRDRDDMSYLAGLIDGEGCFYLANCKNGHGCYHTCPRIIITNTSKDIMDWLKSNYGGMVLTKKMSKLSIKVCYQWVIENQKALMLANWIQPLLIIKKNEVKKLWTKH